MFHYRNSIAALVVLCLPILVAGCSQEVASKDDFYEPATAQGKFPIKVVGTSERLIVPAGEGRLSQEDENAMKRFARKASDASESVSVAYPTKSKHAKIATRRVVEILRREGVAPGRIRLIGSNSAADVMTLSFKRKVAVTQPCGDWSRNLTGDGRNTAYPNFGCSAQNNLAAMVSNPADLDTPASRTAATAASRTTAVKNYETGAWSQTPAALPSSESAN